MENPRPEASTIGSRSLTVLSVAFPLAPVGGDAVGGAEQVLALLDRGLVAAGHHSIVIACAGSRCDGELVATPRPQGPLDEHAVAQARDWHRHTIERVLYESPVDLIHMHGIDFDSYLPPPGPVVLATLHLPPAWYPAEVFALARPRTYLSCVSASQQRECPATTQLVATIDNGVDLELLRPGSGEVRAYALALGRICPEKAFHRALDAARRADTPMLLAGKVYAYAEHQRYFREQLRPRLDAQRRFIGAIDARRKRALMAGARCLLIPSEAAETSSLVAMEALACGTPVITFGAGALAEIVEHGRTGFVVGDEAEMAEAIGRAHEIDRTVCRRAAEQRFNAHRMIAGYLDLYTELLEFPE